jgi:glycosyltransferase involved in cell wall biosynthesis
MTPHRIRFVELSSGGVVGGSLTGALEIIAGLDRRRFAPSLTLLEPKGIEAELVAAGVPVEVLPLPARQRDGERTRLGRALVRLHDLGMVVVPRARALAASFRRDRPTLVYLVNGLTSNLDGVIAAALCGVPMICHEKGFRRVGPVERLMSRWVDRAICMTDDIAAHYRARGVRAHQFLTIPDGVDPSRFTTGGGDRVRSEVGIPRDAPVVGIVGHIQEWKGQTIVVEAVARARERVPEIRCLVVGGVHRAGAEYAARLRELIAREGLEDRVLLMGARRDVAACMSAMDVVLHASVTPEPFGRVLIEAMAAGRPLIAPREGGPREIVADGETGLLVPPRDPAALAAAIVALLSDPARRAAMSAAARARVETLFDIRHQVRAVETVITDVLDGRRTTMVEAA